MILANIQSSIIHIRNMQDNPRACEDTLFNVHAENILHREITQTFTPEPKLGNVLRNAKWCWTSKVFIFSQNIEIAATDAGWAIVKCERKGKQI